MHKLYIHPLPVRLWHWINAIGFVLLIVTGVQIRYVGLIDIMSFRTAVVWHNWIGFAMIANFFVWLLFYLFSDKIKVYHPELSPMTSFRATMRQMQFYGYGIFRGDPNPHQVSAYRKFNPMQSMMYQIIMVLLVPIQFYTGILLSDDRPLFGDGGNAGRRAHHRHPRAAVHLLQRIPHRPHLPGQPRPHAGRAFRGDDHRV